jgi:uncharacterized protein with NRDE domain
MCTLIALHRTVPGAFLVVAANRDEFLDRPADGPALRSTPFGRIAAPLDVEAGGTWFGLSTRGLFAAVTNLACASPDPGRRSRGLLVVDVLGASCAREAAERTENLPMGAYNPFNLFVADQEEAVAFSYEESVRRIHRDDWEDRDGGVFVIGNAALDAPVPTKVARLRERVERAAAGPADAVLGALAGLCRDHEPGARGALDAVCVHTERYGTRSSALLRLAEGGLQDSRSVFRFADGAPCENGYDDFTFLLRALGREGCRVDGG